MRKNKHLSADDLYDLYWKKVAEISAEKREHKRKKLIRDIESGIIAGEVTRHTLENGRTYELVKIYGQKGFVPYDTRTLITEVQKRIDKLGYCPINQRWCLQIRGKDLRRLLKKMPVKQVGRRLVPIGE